MLTSDTVRKIGKLMSAIYRHESNGKTFKQEISPEVTAQLSAIEHCMYGLLDRIAYSHLDRKGKPIHMNAATARAYREAVDAVRKNEGEAGKSDEHWFNILEAQPIGTLDGVLNIEHAVKERMKHS